MPKRVPAANPGKQPQHRATKPGVEQSASFLRSGDPNGRWGDNKLSLLSSLASPAKRSGTDAGAADAATAYEAPAYPVPCREPLQPAQRPLPCDSEGLTAHSDPTSPVASGSTTAAPEGEPPVNSAAPGLQQQLDGGVKRAKRQKKGRGGIYADLIGREVDVPASIFDIKVPDLFYRAVVKKKDTAHPRAVVIRFPEDGSTFWLPVDEVWRYIAHMETRRGLGDDSLAGERSAAYAAEVLVSLSGAAGSSGTQHSAGAPTLVPEARQQQGGGDGAESVMATPIRKRARAAAA